MDDRQPFDAVTAGGTAELDEPAEYREWKRETRAMLARGGLYPTQRALEAQGRAHDRAANTLAIMQMLPHVEPNDLLAIVVVASLLSDAS